MITCNHKYFIILHKTVFIQIKWQIFCHVRIHNFLLAKIVELNNCIDYELMSLVVLGANVAIQCTDVPHFIQSRCQVSAYGNWGFDM